MSDQRESDAASDFVDETMNRATLLEYLVSEPRTPRSLADRLGVSRSTVHRATEKLGELGLLEKTGGEYRLTPLGETVAGEIAALQTNLETAHRLEPFLNTIDEAGIEVPLEAFDDATVTAPQHRQAHVGVNRIIELIEESESLRMFTSILSPLYVDVAHREMLDGTEIEVLFDRDLIDIVVNKYEAEAREAFETGRFHVLVTEAVPFELFLFDDRMGMAAHDDSGIARAFVESTSPDALEWARDVYRSYAAGAQQFDME